MEREAETDVFHARVINACGEDADEDFVEHMSEWCVFVYSVCKYNTIVSFNSKTASFVTNCTRLDTLVEGRVVNATLQSSC